MDYQGEFNVAAFGPILAVFFVGYQFFGPVPLRPVLLSALLVVTLLPTVPTLLEQWKDLRFREWVLEHWDEIDAGTAVLHGRPVGRDTAMACYPLICSAFVIQVRAPGRPVLPGTPTAQHARWTSVIAAAVGGWWCFPTGPFVTLGVLHQGFRDQPLILTLEDVAVCVLRARPVAEVHLDA